MCDIDEVKLPKFLINIFVCVLCVLLTQYFLLRLFGFTRSYVLFVFSSLSLSLGFFFLLFLEVLSNENDYCHHICFTLFTVICEQAMVFFFFVLLLQKILYFVLSLHTKDKNKISESSNGCQFLTYIWPLITCMWQKQCFRDAKYLIKGKYLTFIWPSITCMWQK